MNPKKYAPVMSKVISVRKDSDGNQINSLECGHEDDGRRCERKEGTDEFLFVPTNPGDGVPCLECTRKKYAP